MLTKTNIYDQRDLSISLKRISSNVESLLLCNNDMILTSRVPNLVIQTRFQSLFNYRSSSELDSSLYELIIEHALKAETLGPGSFDKCIRFVFRALNNENMGKYLVSSMNHLDVSLKPLKATKDDLPWLIEHYAIDKSKSYTKMLQTALELAGFGGRIIVEKAQSQISSIELVRGYTFSVNPAFNLKIRVSNPRVFCIDGYIESVGEIHHLLEGASEAKEPAIMFIRGLSDDVRHTLKVNYDRGSLKIIPVIVRFDFEGINTMADIAVVSGTDVISSAKGQLISAVKFEDGVYVKEIALTSDTITIVEPSTSKQVASQVSYIQEKRAKEKQDDLLHLYGLRLQSLSPNRVVMRFIDDHDYVIRSQSTDYVLRAIRSLIDFGTVTIDDEKQLTTTYVASMTYAAKCYQTLQNMGAVIKS